MSLFDLECRYADGGKVSLVANALQAVKGALSHLENGDHAAAAATLRASPAAMQHPQVSAVAGMLQPARAPSAQEVMRRAASQTDPTRGVDPYNTADALAQKAAQSKLLESSMATQDQSPMMMQPGFLAQRQAFAGGGAVKKPTDIVAHLAQTMETHPELQPVLQAHAVALLRANLAAAQAIHAATGDPSGFGHYANAASTLAGALGSGGSGQNDAATQQMMAEILGGGQSRAVAPAAMQAARMAVPAQPPVGQGQVPVASPQMMPGQPGQPG